METPDQIIGYLPYAALAIIPAVAAVILIKKYRQQISKIRSCPHCRALVETVEIACSSCHRKIVFA